MHPPLRLRTTGSHFIRRAQPRAARVECAAAKAPASYEMRPYPAPPQGLSVPPAEAGVLYRGPHGPGYADAVADTAGLRVRGPVDVDLGVSLVEAHEAITCGGLVLTVDGRALLLRRAGSAWRRRGRAIVVFDENRELLVFRLRRFATVSMERADGTVVTRLPRPPKIAGSFVADVQPLEVGLLIAFALSSLAIRLRWDA